jgi:hypothetical protein
MKIFSIAICLFFFSGIMAQDTSISKNSHIYWKWPHYRMDGKRIKARQLNDELNKFPESALYLKKARNNLVISSLMLVPMGVSAFRLDKPTSKYLGKFNPVFLTTLIISEGIAMYSFIRHTKNFKKAIRIHNAKIGLSY